MNRLIQVFVFFLSISTSIGQSITGNSEQIDGKSKPKYPLQSGMVKYDIRGGASGSATLHFDRNGWRSIEKQEIVIKRYGVESKENNIELVDGDFVYSANIDSGKGKKTKDKKWSGLMSYKSKDEALSAIMTSKGATLVKSDTLLEKPCNVWEFKSGTTKSIWEWKGIPLKVVKKLPGISYEMLATNFEENIQLPQETFLLPENITWQ